MQTKVVNNNPNDQLLRTDDRKHDNEAEVNKASTFDENI